MALRWELDSEAHRSVTATLSRWFADFLSEDIVAQQLGRQRSERVADDVPEAWRVQLWPGATHPLGWVDPVRAAAVIEDERLPDWVLAMLLRCPDVDVRRRALAAAARRPSWSVGITDAVVTDPSNTFRPASGPDIELAALDDRGGRLDARSLAVLLRRWACGSPRRAALEAGLVAGLLGPGGDEVLRVIGAVGGSSLRRHLARLCWAHEIPAAGLASCADPVVRRVLAVGEIGRSARRAASWHFDASDVAAVRALARSGVTSDFLRQGSPCVAALVVLTGVLDRGACSDADVEVLDDLRDTGLEGRWTDIGAADLTAWVLRRHIRSGSPSDVLTTGALAAVADLYPGLPAARLWREKYGLPAPRRRPGHTIHFRSRAGQP